MEENNSSSLENSENTAKTLEAKTQNNSETQEKLKNWLKNRHNLLLIGVFAFIIGIKLYYFFLTINQPLWWDESEYMAAAKSFAGIGNYQLSSLRLPGFSLFMSLFFILHLSSEPILRFFGLLLPSLLVILFIYLIIKEMYPDKRIALISVLIMTVLWESLFYSNRFHTETFGMLFELLAIFILFKVYLKKDDFYFIKPKYSLLWVLIFTGLSFFFRPGQIIFFPAVFLFVCLLNKSKAFTKKGIVFISLCAGLVVLSLIYLTFNPIPTMFANYMHLSNPIGWNSLTIFNAFYESSSVPWLPPLFLYAFILGVIFVFVNIYIMLPKIKTISVDKEDMHFKSDLFNVLILLCVLSYFVFVLRDPLLSYRWFFPFLTAMLSFTAIGVVTFSDFAQKIIKTKNLAVILVLLIVVLGCYTQIVHSDQIIKMKLDSYSQVRDSGIWIKENSNKGDIIISASQPQHSYYTERKVENFYVNDSNENQKLVIEKLNNLKPKYIVLSLFEPVFNPQWTFQWAQNSTVLKPVKAYFLDQQKTQVALIVYEVNGTLV